MQQRLGVVGVDVAQAKLVICGLGEAATPQVLLNRAEAIQAWLQRLPAGCVVAMEATGRHHQLLAQLAHAAGMRVLVLNARDVFFYAKALSGRGKTDRLDAALIARFAAEHADRLHAWRPATGVQQQVQDLLRRRAQVTRLRVALRQTLDDVTQLREAGQRLCDHFEELLQEIDRQLLAAVDSDPQLQRGVALLRTITGFGPQGSILVAALLSRIRFDNADALVAYSGLDPRPHDSGAKHGKRRLSKRGPAQ
ncbi:MAG TPA: IS110 family transposase, partial [Burkholderiaceae bacterium]|nr:IS110 family transposase [Burkholderiaceae bacterium]